MHLAYAKALSWRISLKGTTVLMDSSRSDKWIWQVTSRSSAILNIAVSEKKKIFPCVLKTRYPLLQKWPDFPPVSEKPLKDYLVKILDLDLVCYASLFSSVTCRAASPGCFFFLMGLCHTGTHCFSRVTIIHFYLRWAIHVHTHTCSYCRTHALVHVFACKRKSKRCNYECSGTWPCMQI